MNTLISKKKVTLMLDEQVYNALRKKVGGRGIGAYLSQLARPYVVESDVEAGYKAMATDEIYETEAKEWVEGTQNMIDDENVWKF